MLVEDELENVELAGHERTKKNNELKIKKRDYTGYDDDEFGHGTEGTKKSILAKYDDEMSNFSTVCERSLCGPCLNFFQGFRLGVAKTSRQSEQEAQVQAAAVVNKSLLSIDYSSKWPKMCGTIIHASCLTENVEITDYLQEGDVGFKKPKVRTIHLLSSFNLISNQTKKKRPSRRAPVDAELGEEPDAAMAVDEPRPEPSSANDNNFVDDDDLQAALARERRNKMKKSRRLDPEEIARRSQSLVFSLLSFSTNFFLVAEEQQEESVAADMGMKVEEDEEGLVFDDTSEFVRVIAFDPVAATAAPTQAVAKREASLPGSPSHLDAPLKEEEDDDEAILHAMQVDENLLVDEKQQDEAEVGNSNHLCGFTDSSIF